MKTEGISELCFLLSVGLIGIFCAPTLPQFILAVIYTITVISTHLDQETKT